MQSLAPIALFVYNRPDHTRRTLSYLQKNVLANDSKLYIFSDGAKTPGDEQRVQEVRDLAAQVTGFKSVKLISRKQNMGLANSIIDGVTQLVKDYGNVIVFEDDLLSSPYTLEYFNEALARYKNQEKAMHIGAYMFPLNDKTLPETFFYRIATSWGWATWDRAWCNFEPDVDKLITQFDSRKIQEFSVDGTGNFWKQIMEFKTGKNNSWAIRWYASVFLKGGLALHPSQSLIHNIGHDGTGVHSNIEHMYGVSVADKPVKNFPPEVKENTKAHLAIRHFLKNRKGTLLQRGIRLMKQWRIRYIGKK